MWYNYRLSHIVNVVFVKQDWHRESSKHYKAGKRFADENFLSVRTLEMMGDLKHQFLELLMDIGFVPKTNLRRRKHEDKVVKIVPRHVSHGFGFNFVIHTLEINLK